MFKLNEKKKKRAAYWWNNQTHGRKKKYTSRWHATQLSTHKTSLYSFFLHAGYTFSIRSIIFFRFGFCCASSWKCFFSLFLQISILPSQLFSSSSSPLYRRIWFVIILEQLQQGIRRIKTRHLDFFTINKWEATDDCNVP